MLAWRGNLIEFMARFFGDRSVKTLTHFQAAGKNFLIAVLATAALQLTLVLLVLGRRASASAA
jgi:hypothetical protein